LPQDIPGLLQKLFARLEEPKHHGNMLVDHALSYLRTARNGLSEDEMLDLLSEDNEVLADIKKIAPEAPDLEKIVQEVRAIQWGSRALPEIDQKPSFPVVLWSRLFFDLNPYLTERSADGANLISFYHQQLGKVVESMYLKGDAKQARHRAIAQYFAKQPLLNGVAPNLRKMSELPFQQTEGKQWDDLYTTLTDFRFLEEKARTGQQERVNVAQVPSKTYSGIYDLQRDFEFAIDHWHNALQEREGILE
jgi:hypothetical protein